MNYSSLGRTAACALVGLLFGPSHARAGAAAPRPPLSWEEPLPVPAQLEGDGMLLQLPGDGVGPLFHRRYVADIARPRLSAPALMQQIQRDVAAFAPRLLADFRKTRGSADALAVGDEFHITMIGPWDGIVRVCDVTSHSFAFVTMSGHPEAGQICFRLRDLPDTPGALRFEILSWARSRDMLVSLAYHEGMIGREIQRNVWVTFCEHVVRASGGEPLEAIQVLTQVRPFEREVVPRA